MLILVLLTSAIAVNCQTNQRALLLDSVYTSNWINNNWSLDVKNYRNKDGSGRTTESLFKKFNSGTGQFRNLIRNLYTYHDTATLPTTATGQLWYLTSWNSLQYTHFFSKEIPDTTYSKNWDSQHHAVSSGVKNTFQYNDSLLPLVNITQAWDSTTNNWLNTTMITYSYTPGMQPVDRIIQSWQNTTSSWVNVYKYTNAYDLNNVLVGQFEYAWNDTAAIWDNTFRVTYFNNPTSLPNRMVKEIWNTSLLRWDSVEQFTYIYNQYNWLMTILKQNFQQSSWVNAYLTFSTYTEYGVLKTTTGNVWDSIHMTWITDTYVDIDSATQKLSESYTRYVDPQTFLISGGIRNLYAYNPLGDTTSKVNQQWDVPGNDWINKSRDVFTYDTHNLLTEDLSEVWESVSGTWANSKKSEYYYSEFIGIDEHSPEVKPCYYENPLRRGKPVSCPLLDPSKTYEFDLVNMGGGLVFTEFVNGGKTFVINRSLAAGTYILRISDKGRTVYSDKIVLVN